MKLGWTLVWMAALASTPALAALVPTSPMQVTVVSGKYGYAFSLNDAGQYAVNYAGPEIPFEVASIDGGPEPQGVTGLGGGSTRIAAINNLGEAVGTSTTAGGQLHSFLYASGRTRDLTTEYGAARAIAINDRGDITAQAPDERAMVIRDGHAEVFGPSNSVAGAINERGDILVEYFPPGQGSRTAVYSNGELNDLPALGGPHVLGGSINEAGWVSGYGTTLDGRLHALLYDGTSVTDLTPQAANGFAYDINDLGQVVGTMDNRAFLYADGTRVDLNSFVDPGAELLLTSASDINNRGQVLAHACDRAGVFCYDTVLLDAIPPVPEPSRILMLALASSLLGAWSCARARAHAL